MHKAVYKPVWHIPLLSVQWINSWWWTEELPETCGVSYQNRFVKLVHLVGFIINNIFYYYRGGVGPCVSGNVAEIGSICDPLYYIEIHVDYCWNHLWQGNTLFLEKKTAQFYSVNYILHRDFPGTETGSRVANPADKGVRSAKSNLGIWAAYEQVSHMHAVNGIRNRDPNNRDAADLRFRTQGNRHRLLPIIIIINVETWKQHVQLIDQRRIWVSKMILLHWRT